MNNSRQTFDEKNSHNDGTDDDYDDYDARMIEYTRPYIKFTSYYHEFLFKP